MQNFMQTAESVHSLFIFVYGNYKTLPRLYSKSVGGRVTISIASSQRIETRSALLFPVGRLTYALLGLLLLNFLLCNRECTLLA